MKKKLSIKTEIFITLFVFTFLILGLVYLFQTVFLNDFYKNSKKENLVLVTDAVEKAIYNNRINEVVSRINVSNDVCVRVISNDFIYNNDCNCVLAKLDHNSINRIIETTLNNDNSFLFENYEYQMEYGKPIEMYINTKLLSYQNSNIMILVSSLITPLNATISTIKSQYVIIVIIIALLTISLALYLTYRVMIPIKRINSEAKKLADSSYDSLDKINSLEFEELNDTLVKANEDIKKADIARKELLANVSHDLRTPLTMITGYAEMLKDFPEESNEENLDVIIEESKRLSVLVDDLIDISKIEGNNYVLDKKAVSINELLEDVYHQYYKYCEANQVDLKLELADDEIVELDSNRIKQVLYNFVNNALNYNKKDNTKIIIGSEKVKDKLMIYVYDNGQGVSEEDIPKVWDRYYKADKAHERSHIGSGIGLSLAKDLLNAHNFEFGVESKVNEFSKFYFYI